MIKIKNTLDFLFRGQQIGNGTVAVVALFRAPFNGRVAHIAQRIRTAGVTGSQILDCLINGTTIFATAGNKPTLTTGTDATADITKIDGVNTFVIGDLIELKITAVHSGTPAVDTAVMAILKQDVSGTTVEYPSN